jgi:[citrate (pro-3S)-lyase] ligase
MFETIQHLDLTKDTVRKALLTLLSANGLTLDPLVTLTLGVWESERLIGTVSVFKQSIRSFAVALEYQGTNLIGLLVDEAVGRIYAKGYSNVFVLSSQYSARSFEFLGFSVIMKTAMGYLLMERQNRGVEAYCKNLSDFKVCIEDIGAIVMNGNPFTLGHLHLVEFAAKRCAFLYIWVVKEQTGGLPYETRLHLIRKGTAHLKNIFILEGSDYIAARATFPSCFRIASEDMIALYADLDLKIFGHYLARQLGIKKRFVGAEKNCSTTSSYNRHMKKILPLYGIEVIETERLAMDGETINTAHVRECILEGNFQKMAATLPASTYEYLLSMQGLGTTKTKVKKVKNIKLCEAVI